MEIARRSWIYVQEMFRSVDSRRIYCSPFRKIGSYQDSPGDDFRYRLTTMTESIRRSSILKSNSYVHIIELTRNSTRDYQWHDLHVTLMLVLAFATSYWTTFSWNFFTWIPSRYSLVTRSQFLTESRTVLFTSLAAVFFRSTNILNTTLNFR